MRAIIIAAAFAIAAGPIAASAQSSLTDGQVQKIDSAQGKITLRHAPIKNLNMDAMTMVFRVQNPAQLEGLKAGDKVKFEADRVNGQITIIKIEKAR